MAEEADQAVAVPVAEQDGAPNGDNTALEAPSNAVAAPTGKKIVKKIIRKKKRPARVQVDPDTIVEEAPPQTGTIFNIWYGKWSGGDRDTGMSQTKAKGRCNIATDSGYTKADSRTGGYICIRFARGLCTLGADCDRYHRLPGTYDIGTPTVDCFGVR